MFMGTHAEGVFEVKSWDEKTYEQLGGEAKLTHARIRQDFSGDLEATGSWEVLMCYCADGTASYSGLVRVVGRLSGRSGSFVAQTTGGFDGNEARWTWSVVRGSGTEELEGLTGEGSVVAPHGSTGSFSLDHNLDVGSGGSSATGEAAPEPGPAARVPDTGSEL
jgi:hypothetical protein